MFTVNNNTVYWDKIGKLVNDYNNTRHSSTKMKPVEASKKKNQQTFRIEKILSQDNKKRPRLALVK